MDNRTISRQYGNFKTTPYELWFKHKPNIKHLRTFGCAVQILIRKSQRGGKFEEVTTDGVLIGFIDHNHNYKVYDIHSDKVKIVHDVIFLENTFPYRKQPTETLFEEEEDYPTRNTTEQEGSKTTTDPRRQASEDDEMTDHIPNSEREGGLTTLPDSIPNMEVIGNEDVTNPHIQITTPSEDAPTTTFPEPQRSGRERHAPNFYNHLHLHAYIDILHNTHNN